MSHLPVRRKSYGHNDDILKILKELTVPVTTADHIPDKEYEVLGPVLGSITSPDSLGIYAKDRDYDGKDELIRIRAIHRMTTMATELGGDAIIGMRFDSVKRVAWCVYGTAVKFIEKKAQMLKDDDQTSRVSEWTGLSSNTA